MPRPVPHLRRLLALSLALPLLCAAGAAQAQMYKWKDAKGVTHYTDTPPPASAKKAEVKNFSAGSGGELPPELADAVRARPVVLYTTGDCPNCEQGRALLAGRGIPFRERTVNTPEDFDAMKAAGSDGKFPLLLVGRTRQIGFESQTWDDLLTNAGYPAVSALPQGYRNPPPLAAAQPKQPTAAEIEQQAMRAAQEEEARRKAREPDNAPPNFQF